MNTFEKEIQEIKIRCEAEMREKEAIKKRASRIFVVSECSKIKRKLKSLKKKLA